MRLHSLVWLCAVVLISGVAEAAAPQRASVAVGTGYIDAHFAVAHDGKRLAYVHVGDDGKARLLLASLSGHRVRVTSKTDLTKWTMMPSALDFSPDDRFVIVSWKDDPAAKVSRAEYVAFNRKGAFVKRLPSGLDFRFHRDKAGWRVVIYDRQARGRKVTHRVTVLSYPGFAAKGQYRLATDDANRVTSPKMKFIYFISDYLQAVGKIEGRYDKARDIRLPDQMAFYDMAARKVVRERPIKDAIAWEKSRLFRKKHSAMDPVFLLDGGVLSVVMPDNRKLTITSPLQLKRFRPDSLYDETDGSRKALISLTVDPQNPVALRQHRSDSEMFHLLAVRFGSRLSAREVLRLRSEHMVLRWRHGRGVVVVMRLHKNWGLGAAGLWVYPLATGR
ncbi:MAG: hypothetical protein J7M25_06435 [Deltaproteobacteria bacterium]|nr:hypothetical protein [Deltaproteobacteria bacterium]